MAEELDIVNEISALCRAFQSEGMKAPCAIVLQSADDGMRFVSWMCERFSLCPKGVTAPDGRSWNEVVISGVAIRWPMFRERLDKYA